MASWTTSQVSELTVLINSIARLRTLEEAPQLIQRFEAKDTGRQLEEPLHSAAEKLARVLAEETQHRPGASRVEVLDAVARRLGGQNEPIVVETLLGAIQRLSA